MIFWLSKAPEGAFQSSSAYSVNLFLVDVSLRSPVFFWWTPQILSDFQFVTHLTNDSVFSQSPVRSVSGSTTVKDSMPYNQSKQFRYWSFCGPFYCSSTVCHLCNALQIKGDVRRSRCDPVRSRRWSRVTHLWVYLVSGRELQDLVCWYLLWQNYATCRPFL